MWGTVPACLPLLCFMFVASISLTHNVHTVLLYTVLPGQSSSQYSGVSGDEGFTSSPYMQDTLSSPQDHTHMSFASHPAPPLMHTVVSHESWTVKLMLCAVSLVIVVYMKYHC